MNLVIAAATLVILREYARFERKRVAGGRPVATATEPDFKELVAQE
jgi:hypothetical protein